MDCRYSNYITDTQKPQKRIRFSRLVCEELQIKDKDYLSLQYNKGRQELKCTIVTHLPRGSRRIPTVQLHRLRGGRLNIQITKVLERLGMNPNTWKHKDHITISTYGEKVFILSTISTPVNIKNTIRKVTEKPKELFTPHTEILSQGIWEYIKTSYQLFLNLFREKEEYDLIWDAWLNKALDNPVFKANINTDLVYGCHLLNGMAIGIPSSGYPYRLVGKYIGKYSGLGNIQGVAQISGLPSKNTIKRLDKLYQDCRRTEFKKFLSDSE